MLNLLGAFIGRLIWLIKMKKVFFFAWILFLLVVPFISAVSPSGGNVTWVNSSRASADDPQSIAAQAGNVTELNIFGYSVTQSWQGYFGNVSGVVQLADSADNVMYNWSAANPEGEIYASTNDSISWTNIQCFNFTATGDYSDDSANRGATSLYGMNLSQLEAQFGIAADDVDGVDETFTFFGAGTHDLFYTNNLEFSEGECRSTRVFSDSGAGESEQFEEVLLYDPSTRGVVFTALLESHLLGFDNSTHDLEMLVLVDGHDSYVSITNHYSYVELQ